MKDDDKIAFLSPEALALAALFPPSPLAALQGLSLDMPAAAFQLSPQFQLPGFASAHGSHSAAQPNQTVPPLQTQPIHPNHKMQSAPFQLHQNAGIARPQTAPLPSPATPVPPSPFSRPSPALKPILPSAARPLDQQPARSAERHAAIHLQTPLTPHVLLANDMRKNSHKQAEQRRRDDLKQCFDDIKSILPPMQDKAPSKIAILKAAHDHIIHLQTIVHRQSDLISNFCKSVIERENGHLALELLQRAELLGLAPTANLKHISVSESSESAQTSSNETLVSDPSNMPSSQPNFTEIPQSNASDKSNSSIDLNQDASVDLQPIPMSINSSNSSSQNSSPVSQNPKTVANAPIAFHMPLSQFHSNPNSPLSIDTSTINLNSMHLSHMHANNFHANILQTHNQFQAPLYHNLNQFHLHQSQLSPFHHAGHTSASASPTSQTSTQKSHS